MIRAHLRRSVGGGLDGPLRVERTGSTPRVRPSGAALQLDPSPRSSDAGAEGDLSPGPPMLELEDVHARYGANEALHGISLRVAAGTIVTLIGGNGAGKSTTLRAISGL